MHKLTCQTCEDGKIRPRLFFCAKIHQSIISSVEKMGFDAVLLPSDPRLPEPVSDHPDMLVCRVGDVAVVRTQYYLEHSSLFEGAKVVCTDVATSSVYPGDVGLNALILGETVYGRTDCLSREILDRFERHVFVKQGYCACSTMVIGEEAVITADCSIKAALERDGVDVCLIRPGHIALEGYDCGFIGGASVRLDSSRVGLFGSIESHPDHLKMKDFAKGYGVELISLSNMPLTDFGGGLRF